MSRDRSPDRLLMGSDQLELMDRSVEQQVLHQTATDADDARRTVYRERLRAMLPELRKIEGFPIGSDEDILALSDPPYFTACPNPFLGEFIAEHGSPYDEATDDYHREPFAADVSEGRNDPLYKAHSYHTKVPHRAIVPYILHYTDPGSVVLDGFGGSGMAGLAAQWCATTSLAERARLSSSLRSDQLSAEWGHRPVVINDLSPAASFIAANYLRGLDIDLFGRAATELLEDFDRELGWMYSTIDDDGSRIRIDHTVWSQVFNCPACATELVYTDYALDQRARKVVDAFACPTCGVQLSKDKLERRFTSSIDHADGQVRRHIEVRPVLVGYELNGRLTQRPLTNADQAVLDRIEALPYPGEVPTARLPVELMSHGSRIAPKGITRVHHFYVRRAAHALAFLWRGARGHPNRLTRMALLFFVEQAVVGMTMMNRHHVVGRANVNQQLNGVYYIPSVQEETSPHRILEGKLRRLLEAFGQKGAASGPYVVSTGNCAQLGLPSDSIDYVFTDPPFGENIYYADLNFIVESWHRVVTDPAPEAIVDRAKAKKLADYQLAMEACFKEYGRVLKPGRWMTVVFHNSSNAVWNSIQESIMRARFVVADVRTLDKQQGSFRQLTSTAVKQDLVISAYKPPARLEERFALEAGTDHGAWDFIREHLGQLPVFVEHGGRVEVIAERQNYLLYDRMVAFHIQRGATVPLSAGRFYEGLRQRFLERDDMYFTELQAAEYDRRRLDADEVEQLSVFVIDEKSAIHWLRAQLLGHPQSYSDLFPKFLQELNQNRYEELPELRDILAENFLEDPATHRWRVPDPAKQADLDALRGRGLLNEFRTYLTGTTKLKRFRIEAIRAGFADLWANRDYRAIIKLAERLPDEVVQEDPALLMYYDNALTREGVG